MNGNLSALLAQYRDGFGLPRGLYLEEQVYRAELERIWRKGWLFAGHSIEIQEPGDYFLFSLGAEELIVARTETGAIAASHNLCRHRGSLVVTEASGHARRLVCPYHQWTYAPDGELMPEDLDKSAWGLKRVAACELEGLIFVCLANEPPDFEPAAALMAPMVRPQGFGRARR
ncbi:MAG TPA: Rieske (2Fe-2S) protein [Anaerolineaceae bacterium]|nr:Rieske (2Fe-2S) protein [Anaerolineaceae bacterium]